MISFLFALQRHDPRRHPKVKPRIVTGSQTYRPHRFLSLEAIKAILFVEHQIAVARQAAETRSAS